MTGSKWWAALLFLALLALLLREGLLAAFVLVLALAGAVSELWSRHCLTGVTYRRHLGSEFIPFGQETTLDLEFVNAKPLPLAWLLVRDEYPRDVTMLEGGIQGSPSEMRGWMDSFVSLRWYERVTRRYRLRGDQRGVFHFGPAEISSGDILGFRNRQRVDTHVDTLVVYPKILTLEQLGLPAERPLGDLSAMRRLAPDPLRFASVRDYAPGDQLRTIHWKATARAGRLQTKVFDPSASPSIVLAVDVQTLPGAYEYRPLELEFAISAAASIASYALDEQTLVGLGANAIDEAGHQYIYVPPGRHPQQLQILLAAMASLRPIRGLPFENLLDALVPQLPLGATLVAITAFPRSEILETLLTLHATGRPVVFLPVVEQLPPLPDELITYPLRGADGWRSMETLQLA